MNMLLALAVASLQPSALSRGRSHSPGRHAMCVTDGIVRNQALVFIKPSANTEKTRDLVEASLARAKIQVVSTSSLSAEAIDKRGVIDKHYYSIASKATLGTAETLPVDEAAFAAFFGTEYKDAKAGGHVLNAMEACAHLGCDGGELEAHWEAAAARGLRCKLGGGFYVGRLDADLTGAAEACYVFNGFFMKMRSEYTKPGSSVQLYSVVWDAAELSWASFRGEIIGATIPSEATPTSIRGSILERWEVLGLPAEPYAGDNGVHASAGPFEGLAERVNWLGGTVADDAFGAALLGEAGMSEAAIAEWMVDPQVALAEGRHGSLFDALEDLDAEPCLAMCAQLSRLSA